jgi:uncharacterized protein (TIGR02996 family)
VDERRALMAAIIANPDEDTPRLALADWLQEHGDEHDQARAEFIRLQIRAENLPSGAERKKLTARADKLEGKHGEAWLAPLAAYGGREAGMFGRSDFDRGLYNYLFVTTSDFLLKAWQNALPDALARTGVEGLYFYSPTKRIADFAASPALRWVARVQYPGADDRALAAFASSPNFAHLSGLDFQEVRLTDAGLRDFAKTTNTARLREVAISTEGGLTHTKAKFTAAGVLALLHSDRLPHLDALDIECGSAAKFGMEPFLADTGLRKLRKLRLGIHLPASEVLPCPHLANLHTLELVDASCTDADVSTLLGSPTFAGLKTLWLVTSTRLAPATVKKLEARFGDGLRLENDE